MSFEQDYVLFRVYVASDQEVRQSLNEIVKIHLVKDERCTNCNTRWPCATMLLILEMLQIEPD